MKQLSLALQKAFDLDLSLYFDFFEHEAGPIAFIVLAWPITAFVMTQCRLCALTNL